MLVSNLVFFVNIFSNLNCMIQGYDYDNDNVHYMNLVDSFIDVESNIVIDSEEVL